MANYSVLVSRQHDKAYFEDNELLIPLIKNGKTWKRAVYPVAMTKNMSVTPHARDLLDVAAAVYYSDKHLPRNERENWIRNIDLKMSLRDPEQFREIEPQLKLMLNVLGGDNFTFEVTQMQPEQDTEPRFRRKKDPPAFTDVSLISGGQDSGAGALELLKGDRLPLFIRINLGDGVAVNKLRSQLTVASRKSVILYRQPAASLSARAGSKLPVEPSQRLRSFYFLAISSVVAQTFGCNDVYINENGIMAVHLPLDPSRASTFSTRTAYPVYLSSFAELCRRWINFENIKVKNIHLQKTKSEVISEAVKSGGAVMMRKAISCAHSGTIKRSVKNMKRRQDLVDGDAQQLHCGYCFPCILRRISMFTAGLEARDVKYVFNPFRLTMETKSDYFVSIHEASSAILNLISFVRSIRKSSDLDFLIKYGQISECAFVEESSPIPLIELHRRFAQEVINYVEKRAGELLYLFDDERSAAVDMQIRQLSSPDILESALRKIGTYQWNDHFENQMKEALGELRVQLQVSLANGKVTPQTLISTFEDLLRDALPSSDGAEPTDLNLTHGTSAKKEVVLGCKTKCWPLTRA